MQIANETREIQSTMFMIETLSLHSPGQFCLYLSHTGLSFVFITEKEVNQLLFFLTNTENVFSFMSFLSKKETWIFFFFNITHTYKSTTFKEKLLTSVFIHCCFFFLLSFIDSRENNQIGAFLHTLVWLFPDVQRIVLLLTNWSQGTWLMNQHLSPH